MPTRLVGILARIAPDLFKLKAIDSLTMLLSQVDDIDEKFSMLKPILYYFQTGDINYEELDDCMYGLSLLVDLMNELCNPRLEQEAMFCA